MKALSEATNAQRFEAAVKPVGYDEVTPEEKERSKTSTIFAARLMGKSMHSEARQSRQSRSMAVRGCTPLMPTG